MNFPCRVYLSTAVLMGLLLTTRIVQAGDRDPSPEKERELIMLLQSDAPAAEKAISCKRLAVHGSAASVPELSRLLESDQLASWARIALEVIPGPEADAALRQATNSITGRLLVGTINSIGVRRDAAAVDLLASRLKDADPEVAAAAAVALGRIGNAPAAKALRPLIATAPTEIRSAIAEGAILCAERSLAENNRDVAAAIYDEVRKADVPRQRVLEATRGAILARPADAGIALLIEQLNSEDPGLFRIGLTTAREFPGQAIDKALADELNRAKPERAALIVTAMADRTDTVVLSAVLKAAASGSKPVRLSAVRALGRIGDQSCLLPLLNVGTEADPDLVSAARNALGDLRGDSINKEIVARISKSDGKLYTLLLEIVGERRIDAIPELKKALDHPDSTVRSAALKSLGATVALKDLKLLITPVASPRNEADKAVAQVALKTACVRMPDREGCAEEVAAALKSSSTATKAVMLEILQAVGGTKALQTVAASARSADPELQDVGSRLLGEWATIDAAPVLLDLSKTAPDGKYKVRAFKGYVRIARQFAMADPVRIQMCQEILTASKAPADQKTVLEILKRYPSLESLKLALSLSQEIPELKDDATQAMVAIAAKLGNKGPEVSEILARGSLGKVKLEIVKAEYGAGTTIKDVTEVLQKQASEVQLISLAQANYNEAFGGDPAPNTVKQLKVQYKINGKDGQATFPENALIILPMPK